MATQPERLKARTKQFAIRIVRVFKRGKINQSMSRRPNDPMAR